MPNGSALWERALVCRPTHPKTAHSQLSRSCIRPFIIFNKASHESALTPFLGTSTRCVDQAQSCSRRKRGRVREDSLGLREGAMGGWALQAQTKAARSEAWLVRRGSSHGRTHSEQLGLGTGPGSGQVGDLHKVRDQAQSCSKRKLG